jgi:hypothetical protein
MRQFVVGELQVHLSEISSLGIQCSSKSKVVPLGQNLAQRYVSRNQHMIMKSNPHLIDGFASPSIICQRQIHWCVIPPIAREFDISSPSCKIHWLIILVVVV